MRLTTYTVNSGENIAKKQKGEINLENAIGSCVNSLPLAMAYVPMQKWQKLYEPEMSLMRGTMFAELDKPFLGEALK